MSCAPVRALPAATAYILAAAACGLTALGAMPLRHVLDLANIIMLFLLAVYLVALKLGRGPAVLASVLSVALFDFIFVPPHLAFVPEEAQYLVTLAAMLVVSLVTTQLTAGLQEQAGLACRRERQAQRLYQLARDLAGSVSRWEVQGALDAFLKNTGYRAVLRLLDEGAEAQGPGRDERLESHIVEAVRRGEPVEGDLSGPALFLPLNAPTRVSGVMVVTATGEGASDLHQERNLLMVVASLLAIAIERLHYVEVAQETQLQVASERLRTSLLSALSHDLRTPLTALVGMADALALSHEASDPASQEAAAALSRQARQMSNLLNNLLDMARFQAGRVVLRREWQLFDDVIASSVRLLKPSLTEHPIRVRLEPDLPLVEFDAVLMERVICNLLENAAKYSAVGAPIEIGAYVSGEWACLTVCDRGPGFPPGKAEGLFGLFVRGAPESSKSGVGLGLAICRAIMDAHGGTIRGENRPEGGACVTLQLPLGSPPAIEEEDEAAGGAA